MIIVVFAVKKISPIVDCHIFNFLILANDATLRLNYLQTGLQTEVVTLKYTVLKIIFDTTVFQMFP